jgi:anthranilate phosphoribosyltransferase
MEDDIRRVLGLAIQILEDMPEHLQPHSNIEDIRKILAGEETGRGPLIIAQAIATALAFRTQQALTVVADGIGHVNRMNEFSALFGLVQRCDVTTLTMYFVGACDQIAMAEKDQ